MSVTIDLDDNDSIRLLDGALERRPPNRLAFTVDGSLSVTDALLAEFEGATVTPTQVTVSAPDSEPVAIDLTESATLRLENVDVGIATPDGTDITDGIDSVRPSTDDDPGPIGPPPDVLSFTVDGEIRDVPSAVLESVAGDAPQLESLTFAVDESVRSDGGRGDDVILELTLLGYGIVVRRDGSIVVGNGGSLASIDLP